MKVYRIEQKDDGRGPYFHPVYNYVGYSMGQIPTWQGDGMMNTKNGIRNYVMAAETNEERNKRQNDVVAAVPSEEELLVIANDTARRELIKHGFKVRVYEVDDTHVWHGKSGRQVAFKKSEATLVEEREITPPSPPKQEDSFGFMVNDLFTIETY